MNMLTLDDLVALSRRIRASADPRPGWLQKACDEPMSMASYYLFLYELARRMQPAVILETGTRYGHSAAQLAAGAPTAAVYTIDVMESSKRDVQRFPVPNVVPFTGDSLGLVDQVRAVAPVVDILLLDSEHSYRVCKGEYMAYRPLVRPGGVILIDDIFINPELLRVWNEVVDPKAEATYLHYMGFGICTKDASRNP